MKKVLFVDACVRKASRTRELAESVLNGIDGILCRRELCCEPEEPLNEERLEQREQWVSEGDYSHAMFDRAKEFAGADEIVIAAPYWDLSFPALLKLYLEQVSVCGLTFCYSKGVPHGLCKAGRLIYVTTAGGIVHRNLGFEYVRALAEDLYGIPEVRLFQADGLDIRGNDVQALLQKAKNEAASVLSGSGRSIRHTL